MQIYLSVQEALKTFILWLYVALYVFKMTVLNVSIGLQCQLPNNLDAHKAKQLSPAIRSLMPSDNIHVNSSLPGPFSTAQSVSYYSMGK